MFSGGDPVGREHLRERPLLTDAPRRFEGVRNPVPILDGQPGGRVYADMVGGGPEERAYAGLGGGRMEARILTSSMSRRARSRAPKAPSANPSASGARGVLGAGKDSEAGRVRVSRSILASGVVATWPTTPRTGHSCDPPRK